MKKGTVLIAKDPCIMKWTGERALIVGKEYTVTQVVGLDVEDFEDGYIRIDSELGDHKFIVEDVNKYFDIKG